jgi:hypothetical protein
VISVQDIFNFLAAYLAGEFRADFNGSEAISVQESSTSLGVFQRLPLARPPIKLTAP